MVDYAADRIQHRIWEVSSWKDKHINVRFVLNADESPRIRQGEAIAVYRYRGEEEAATIEQVER